MAKNHRKLKRAKSFREDQYLPFEIWFQILTRVPVKTLLKFRCVSTTWCSMIDSSDFASQQFKLCKTNSANTHLVVFERSSKWGDKGCILRRYDDFRKIHQYDLVTFQDGIHFEVEDYINGVFLMHRVDRSEKMANFVVVLWNPSIRKSVKIPPPPIWSNLTSKLKVEISIGFDSMKQDYKVLVITYYKIKDNLGVSIELYMLNTNSWRVISREDLHFWCAGEKSYLDGFIYMAGFEMQPLTAPTSYDNAHYTHLVTFDVSREVFDAVHLPNVENPLELLGRSVVLTNRSVALFDYGSNCSIVWGLEKNRRDWSKLYTINSVLDGLFYDSRKGLFYLENNRLFFEGVGRKFWSYEIETKQLKLLSKGIAFESVLYMDTYVESLALLANTTSNTRPFDDDDDDDCDEKE